MVFYLTITLSVVIRYNDDSLIKRYFKIENSMFMEQNRPFWDGNVKRQN